MHTDTHWTHSRPCVPMDLSVHRAQIQREKPRETAVVVCPSLSLPLPPFQCEPFCHSPNQCLPKDLTVLDPCGEMCFSIWVRISRVEQVFCSTSIPCTGNVFFFKDVSHPRSTMPSLHSAMWGSSYEPLFSYTGP